MVWRYGETVLYRYGRQGRTHFVRVGRVIADDAQGLTLWIAPGSPQIESVLPDGRNVRDLPLAQRFQVPRERRRTTWRGPGLVQYAPTAGDWSVWWFFDDAGRFKGWYGNLESPRVRGAHRATRTLDRRPGAGDPRDRRAPHEACSRSGTALRRTVDRLPTGPGVDDR